MAEANLQKFKMLKLYELLQQETDEDHPLKTGEIIERLAEMGISCDRRTLSRDIKQFNGLGYEVMSILENHERAYYIVDRSFSVPELKILIDAVQAASFITDKKTSELIDKIAALGGSHHAEIMKSNIVHFNTRKHSNESIYYAVDSLETAIQQNKKITFKYFDLDESGSRKYRRDGERYVTEPVALVYNEDNYYLICYSEKHDDTVNYRVDRMDGVDMLRKSITEKAKALRESVADLTEEMFKMYGGAPERVALQFGEQLIGAVYDKFGEGVQIVRADSSTCTAEVSVQISPTFWGWLFQFGSAMKIIEPAHLIEEYRKKAQAVLEN